MLLNFATRLAGIALALTTATGTVHAASSPAQSGAPEIKVFPAEAITAAMRYEKSTFQDLYPGIDVTYTGITDEGFYIRYSHLRMIFFFGPIENVEEAVQYRGDLDYLRNELIRKKPELETSTVHLVRVNHRADGSTHVEEQEQEL